VKRRIAIAVAALCMLALVSAVGTSVFKATQNEKWVLRSDDPVPPETTSAIRGVLRERATALHPAFSPIVRSNRPGEFTVVLRGELPPRDTIARVFTERGRFELLRVDRVLSSHRGALEHVEVGAGERALPDADDASTVYVVEGASLFGGDAIREAWVEIAAGQHPVVMLGLWPKGRDPLRAFTEEHIGERLAVVLDGRVYAALEIDAPLGDLVKIDAGWQMAERRIAVELAAILTAGALPVPLVVAEAP